MPTQSSNLPKDKNLVFGSGMFYRKDNEIKNKKIVYVFIDASNIWEVQKAKGKLFDYEKLK